MKTEIVIPTFWPGWLPEIGFVGTLRSRQQIHMPGEKFEVLRRRGFGVLAVKFEDGKKLNISVASIHRP